MQCRGGTHHYSGAAPPVSSSSQQASRKQLSVAMRFFSAHHQSRRGPVLDRPSLTYWTHTSRHSLHIACALTAEQSRTKQHADPEAQVRERPAGASNETIANRQSTAHPKQQLDSSSAAKVDRLSSHAAASTSGQQQDSTPIDPSSSHHSTASAADMVPLVRSRPQHAADRRASESQWEFIGVYRSKGASGKAKPPNQLPRLNPSMWQQRPSDSSGDESAEYTAHLTPRRPRKQPADDPVRRDAMHTKVLEVDKSFKPLKLIEPMDMRLNLELQGLEPVQHNRQVWKTETWALVQVGRSVPVRLADGREVTGRAVLLPRLGPFVIGSARDADCDLVIDSPGMQARPVRLELVHGGSRGRVVRMTVSDTGSGESVWVNRNRLPHQREIEARSHNIITIAHRDIAFQVVPLSGGDNLLWDLEVAQRLRLQLRDAQGRPRYDKRVHRKDDTHFVQLGNEERVSCMQCQQPVPKPPCCVARAFFRAAVGLQEQRSMEATAAAQPRGSQAGMGQYAQHRSTAASKPYTALGSNSQDSVCLVRTLGWWAKLEMHLGNVSSARRLWRRAVNIARKHPRGLVSGSGFSQLLAWARLEALNAEFDTAEYLLQEALKTAPGDRRLHLMTSAIQDLKRLSTERQSNTDVAWSPGEASLGGVRKARSSMKRRRWATLPKAQRPSKRSVS